MSTLGLCLQRSQHALMLSPTSFTRTVRPYWPLNEQGLTVDYLESFDRSSCYFLATLGLPAPHSEAIPQDRQSCVSGHSAVQLAGGLIRLAVHHWGQGIRSCLILPRPWNLHTSPSFVFPSCMWPSQGLITICNSDTGGCLFTQISLDC